MGGDFVWVQKAADGSVCKLWHHCTQCVISLNMKSQRNISNEFQYNPKQDLILISKKTTHDILVILMFLCDKGMAIPQIKFGFLSGLQTIDLAFI